ncbi:MAG: cyclic nucleotide-binding domain-containing protein [Candidatus Saganbacteria bacterium]|nr:cyclic nucleotide-binding domain-containing protein [Candidatus Saganbacteria bacterium]
MAVSMINGVRANPLYVSKSGPRFACIQTQGMGRILFGAPPEVIKHFMPDFFISKDPSKIPTTLVAPRNLFSNGHILLEPEFPQYANTYFANRNLRILATGEQTSRIKTILGEANFGPLDIMPADIRREIEYFAPKKPDSTMKTINDMVDFRELDERSEFKLNGVTIRNIGEGVFRVSEHGREIATVDTSVFENNGNGKIEFANQPFIPPVFGMTFVGTTSGFDASGRTTSMILWAGTGRKGIFIDPLSDPQAALAKLGIEVTSIPHVFLSHTHADHDAGVLASVLNGNRVNLIASALTYASFLRKGQAYSGIDISHLISWIEARFGETLKIPGMPALELDISRAFHFVPTTRFIARFTDNIPGLPNRERSIAYSADTLYGREILAKCKEIGVINTERHRDLTDFVEKCPADRLVHEAGNVPHTDPLNFAGLTDEIKRKMVLVHTGKVPDGVNIPIARERETIPLISSRDETAEIFQAMSGNRIFGSLPARLISQVARNSRMRLFIDGENIAREGDPGDNFYFIINGHASVEAKGIQAVLKAGDYFGEASLLTGLPKNATIKGLSSGSLIEITRHDFELMIKKVPELRSRLKNVLETRPTLSQIVFLKNLKADALADLSSRFEVKRARKGQKIIRQGQQGDALYVIKKGQVKIVHKNEKGRVVLKATLGENEVFGEISLVKNMKCTATVEIVSEGAELLQLPRKEFDDIREDMPGLIFHLTRLAQQRLDQLNKSAK